ncbi:hypothetical protein KBB96_19865 [Luteolibacter ambystomatis]|uniref:Uncharacterized protein n=1 Tax=Luteolibacter ambystomatis TaxID=2824561 RepID=A0A975G8M1_9BACT|nr:hypothetical protein [Luteolibacter ambystomatis]QUE51099.1 hypothetical protein KBB96_19865 [Luteolibacter ambystomatis]
MSDPAERFLNILARPFSDNAELQIHVRRGLEERMTAAAGDPAAWDKPATTLDFHDKQLWRRRWRWWLGVLVLLVSLVCLRPMIEKMDEFEDLASDPFMRGYCPDNFDEAKLQQHLSKTLPEEQQRVLFGGGFTSRAEKWEALWKHFPDRPDYLAQYASARAPWSLPDGFTTTAERIDPDNAWFPAFAAAVKSRKAVDSKAQTKAQTLAHAPKEWDVLDAPLLAACMELLHKAASMPRFDSYSARLKREKLALLPPATTSVERMQNLSFVSQGRSGTIPFQMLHRAVAAQAWLLANQGKKEEFQTLAADWTRVAHWQAESSDSMLENVIMRSDLINPLSNLGEGAERLGFSQQAARFKIAAQQARTAGDPRRIRETPAEVEQALKNHGGAFAREVITPTSAFVDDPPVPSASALKPDRMVDQSRFHRIVCVAVFPVALLMSSACALYRFRSGHLLRRLSARLTDALGPADWAWIFAAAVLPLVHLAILYSFTPLGGREWGYDNPGRVTKIVQLAAWLLLTMTTPVVAARWRLQCRLPGIAITNRRPLGLGILVTLGYIASGIAGIYYLCSYPEAEVEFLNLSHSLPSGMEWPAIASLLLLPLLWWWFSHLLRAACTSYGHAFGRQMMARMLVPAWTFLLLPVALLIPLCELQERYWIPRDTLLGPGLDLATYEGQIVSRMKEENLDVLRILEPDR